MKRQRIQAGAVIAVPIYTAHGEGWKKYPNKLWSQAKMQNPRNEK